MDANDPRSGEQADLPYEAVKKIGYEHIFHDILLTDGFALIEAADEMIEAIRLQCYNGGGLHEYPKNRGAARDSRNLRALRACA
ncbi:hypothetical protein GCM10023310_17370 [Paenibacillus vulneris]